MPIPRELSLAFAPTADHRISMKIPVVVDEVQIASGFEWDGHTASVGEVGRDLRMLLDDEPLDLQFSAQGIELQRSEEHTSELQSLMRNSYAVLCLKKK